MDIKFGRKVWNKSVLLLVFTETLCVIAPQIMRATNNNGIETIHQGAAVIQDLVLDAVHGYMYWTTINSLESSRLDGHGHEIIRTVPGFLGKYILGVTLRYENQLFNLLNLF